MFVKLLVLLFSNVFASFSVLLCCRSWVLKSGSKGGIKQGRELAPISAIEHICTKGQGASDQPRSWSSVMSAKYYIFGPLNLYFLNP